MPTVPFSLRLETELKERLREEACRTERSESYLAQKAIEAMLDARQVKRDAISDALKEADKGAFISQSAMHDWVNSWGSSKELAAPDPDIFPTKS